MPLKIIFLVRLSKVWFDIWYCLTDAKELRECIHDAILMMTMILTMMMTMMGIILIMMMTIMMMYLVTLGGGAVWFGGGAWLGGGTVNLCGTIVGGGT